MTSRNGRLSLAHEVQSVARPDGNRAEKLEGPAATLLGGGQSACDAKTRDLPTLTRCDANGSADMAERTRLPSRSDSRTPDTAVKITPATHQGPVTTTHTVA